VYVHGALQGGPIAGVHIRSTTDGESCVSDAFGRFDLSAFAESDTLLISHLNYSPMQVVVGDIRSGPQPFTIALLPEERSLEAVNISAIRNPEHEQPTAARVALLDAELIYQNAPATSADALSATGEVFVQKSQQGGGSPMIRGFAANRLLIVVDGVRMNNAIFRAGNLQNVISIDPLALEGAQVIFGPGSVVYGSDALGGVMAFETLKPVFGKVDSIHVDAKAISRYSSANQGLMGQVQAKVGNGQWASVTSGSYNAFGDLRMGRHGPTDWQRTFFVERRNNEDLAIPNPEPNLQVGSGYRQVNLMQKVAYRPNDSWDFQYAFHLSTTNDIPRYDRLIEVQQAQPRHAEWHYGPQEWMLNQLSINGRRASTLYDELHINLAHQRFGEGRINRRFGSDDRFNREERVQAYSAIIDLNKRLGSSGLLDYGIEWVHNDVRTSGYQENINTGLRASVLPRLPDSEWASYAAFAAFRQKWLGGHTLQIGLRYNAFSMHSRFDTTMIALPFAEASLFNAAPAGSIGYSFTQGEWRYEALATTGFRAPNVDDVGKVFDSEPGSVTVPNAALRPEQAWNAELGLSYHADRAPQFHLSAYYTYLDGAMVRRNSTLNGQDSILYEGVPSQVQQLQNAAYAEVYGVQARLEWMLPGGWQLRSSFNWQRGTEVDNEGLVSPARHAAPWFGLSRIGYSHKGFYLEINAMYSGGFSYEQLAIEERGKPFLYARDAEGRPYSPSWYTLNFRSNYQLDAHWRFDFGVENLSDQRYRSYSSGIAGPGRNWIVGVARSW
jgi:hemoglobin/transferrin/lactoferrin receptor protein